MASGSVIKVLCVPAAASIYSNSALKKGDIYNEAIKSGAKGLPFLKVTSDGTLVLYEFSVKVSSCSELTVFCGFSGALEGIPALASSLNEENKEKLLNLCSAKSGDLILFAVGVEKSVNKTLDRLRLYVAHELGLVDHVSIRVISLAMMGFHIG